MPTPDRLQDLLRQRALLQEHLAWIDREIGQASGGVKPPAPGHVSSPVTAGDTTLPPDDKILEQYRAAPNALQAEVKQGCLLYFVGAFVLLALAVAAFYYLKHRA